MTFRQSKDRRSSLELFERLFWTRNKAKLIERYLNLFVMVTKHGVYIDGFAAHSGTTTKMVGRQNSFWKASRRGCGNFSMGDFSQKLSIAGKPTSGAATYPRRTIELWKGDFNELVDEVLANHPSRKDGVILSDRSAHL